MLRGGWCCRGGWGCRGQGHWSNSHCLCWCLCWLRGLLLLLQARLLHVPSSTACCSCRQLLKAAALVVVRAGLGCSDGAGTRMCSRRHAWWRWCWYW